MQKKKKSLKQSYNISVLKKTVTLLELYFSNHSNPSLEKEISCDSAC